MEIHKVEDLVITLEKEGADRYIKISAPIRYGVCHEIKSPDYTFQFNLNGEIRTIQGRGEGWLDAAEWLKRTPANDWTYFSAGGYSGAFDFTGEYYVPCLSYDTNAVLFSDRFNSPDVEKAFAAWHNLRDHLSRMNLSDMPAQLADFIRRAAQKGPEELGKRAQRFHEIIGGEVSVLPPDARHVEYDVIPVIIADGCLYNCTFCRVKSGKSLTLRTRDNISEQIQALREFFGPELVNHNSIFLGQHDALFADKELIASAARQAYDSFEIGRSKMKEPRMFLFGSVDSMLRCEEEVFEMLERLPFYTYINLGLESADADTFTAIGKPLTPKKVTKAFKRMMEINQRYPGIEVSGNFIYGADLPQGHLSSIADLTHNHLKHFHSKGTIYVSPMENIGSKEEMRSRFLEFKRMCRLPCYMYLIQRL
ncbi:MAG: radical SAM protein [Desulfosalsimonadaceae bacterium]